MKKLQTKIFNLKSEIGKVSKDSKNPFFKSQYMDLNTLLEVVEPLMTKHKLLLTQPLEDGNVCTVITDVDTGENSRSSIAIPAALTDPQKIGSCITYFRRYTLKSLLAIQETDDDANKASRAAPTKLNPVFEPLTPAKTFKSVTAKEILAAKNALNKCKTMPDLQKCYLALDKDVAKDLEVIAKKDDMKELLTPNK